MADTNDDTIQNRSEIAFVIDAKDTNPNGDPLTADNEPRIDPVTGQCVVTDVRLKRYLRDQLEEDGHVVLIANPNDDVLTREEMYDAVAEEMVSAPVMQTPRNSSRRSSRQPSMSGTSGQLSLSTRI